MLTYSLNCSVCQGEYSSRDEWSRHLTTDRHQTLAREECLQKWNRPNGLKECCLVVFASFPLTPSSVDGDGNGGAEKVIRHFSTKDPKIFVTDFVWWDDRARYGILQFGSKDKALEMLSKVDSSKEVLVDNNARVQIKWAGELLELEWTAVLPTDDVSIPARDNPAVPPNNDTTATIEPVSCDDSCSTVSGSAVLAPDETNVSDNRSLLTNKEIINISSKSSHNTDNAVFYHMSVISSPSGLTLNRSTSRWRNAITDLEELAIQRKWNPPEFQLLSSNVVGLSKYVSRVILNGMKYVGAGKTEEAAKQQAALFCLGKLTTSVASSPMQDCATATQSGNVTDSYQERYRGSGEGKGKRKQSLDADESNNQNAYGDEGSQISKKSKTESTVQLATTTEDKEAIQTQLTQLMSCDDSCSIGSVQADDVNISDNDNDRTMSTNNGVGYHVPVMSSPMRHAISDLEELAKQRNWKPPVFGSPYFTSDDGCLSKYVGSVTVNGMEYIGGGRTKDIAKQQAALNCLRKLPPPSNLLKYTILELEKLARQRKWNPPEFKCYRAYTTPEGQVKYISCVTLNGVDYKPTDEYARVSKLKAKRQGALYCLKMLTATQNDATPQLENASDSCQERYHGSGEGKGTKKQRVNRYESNQNGYGDEDSQILKKSKPESTVPTNIFRGLKATTARSTLRELAQRNYWKPPRYKLLNTEMFEGKPLYSFSVKLNGVEYHPDASIPKADSKEMAKSFMAELCLLKQPLGKPIRSKWLMILRNGKIIYKRGKVRKSGSQKRKSQIKASNSSPSRSSWIQHHKNLPLFK